jgi:hypothetical protein
MASKFRKKNYYKTIITILICLLLGFLYLGNYNLIEGAVGNQDSSNNVITTPTYKENRAIKSKQANNTIAATGGNNGSDGYNAQIQAFALSQTLEDKNTF